MKERTAARSVDIRSLIVRTALRLFAERGYFNTSIHDIRKAADISIGAIYHYFSGKEAIAKAIYDDLVARMAEAVAVVMKELSTARDRSQAVIQLLFEMAEDDPEMMHFILYARHREFMPDEPPICSSRPFELMKDIVKEGMASGEIRPMDPLVAAAGLFGGAIRMIHLYMDGIIAPPLKQHLEEVWSCGWRGIAHD
ncbi:MAG: TetR/AcrR family transcriptional regulator [Nitrospirota bacterium]